MNEHIPAIKTLASIGLSCQTSVQLTYFAENNIDRVRYVKGPFDWMICPPEGFCRWLDADMPVFTRGEITLRRGFPWWERFGLWFWHGFSYVKDGARYIDIDKTFDNQLSKVKYQRRCFKSLDPLSTVFFWSNTQNNLTPVVFQEGEEKLFHLNKTAVSSIGQSMERFFDSPIALEFVSREDRANTISLENSNIRFLARDRSRWKGDYVAWDRNLKETLMF